MKWLRDEIPATRENLPEVIFLIAIRLGWRKAPLDKPDGPWIAAGSLDG